MSDEQPQVGIENEAQAPAPEAQAPPNEEMNESFGLPKDHPAIKALEKTRREAAGKRVKVNELEEKAKLWEEYENSQKTELEKLTQRAAELEAKVRMQEKQELQYSIAEEFEIPRKLAKFIDGSDEDDMRDNAKLLAESLGEKAPVGAPDLHGGNRGNPVVLGPSEGGQFLLDLSNNLAT